MTTENKSIWHTPQEQFPGDDEQILFYVDKFKRIGWYDAKDESFNDYYTGHDYDINSVARWCNINELIASSKALDVAHYALRYYRDKDYETDCTVAADALNEISKIMKKKS